MIKGGERNYIDLSERPLRTKVLMTLSTFQLLLLPLPLLSVAVAFFYLEQRVAVTSFLSPLTSCKLHAPTATHAPFVTLKFATGC